MDAPTSQGSSVVCLSARSPGVDAKVRAPGRGGRHHEHLAPEERSRWVASPRRGAAVAGSDLAGKYLAHVLWTFARTLSARLRETNEIRGRFAVTGGLES
jgi:hypothetical protein